MVDFLVQRLRRYDLNHAADAVKSGAFTTYFFNNGDRLKVRTKLVPLLRRHDFKFEPAPFDEDDKPSSTTKPVFYQLGKLHVAARSFEPRAPRLSVSYTGHIAAAIGRRVRFEQPLLELFVHPNSMPPVSERIVSGSDNSRLVITSRVEGYPLWKYLLVRSDHERAAVTAKVASIVARLNATGVFHGHPHPANWIVTKDGKPVLFDHKYIDLPPTLPTPDEVDSVVSLFERDNQRTVHGLGAPILPSPMFAVWNELVEGVYDKNPKFYSGGMREKFLNTYAKTYRHEYGKMRERQAASHRRK